LGEDLRSHHVTERDVTPVSVIFEPSKSTRRSLTVSKQMHSTDKTPASRVWWKMGREAIGVASKEPYDAPSCGSENRPNKAGSPHAPPSRTVRMPQRYIS
jgi:hypothetical protein